MYVVIIVTIFGQRTPNLRGIIMDEIATAIDRLDWLYKYKPIPNHLSEAEYGWCYNADRQPLLFNSSGEELDYIVDITKEDPSRVWTWTEEEQGYFIICGFQPILTYWDQPEGEEHIYKGGYFVTDKPGTIGVTRAYYTGLEAMGMDDDLRDWF